jgi:hypothetical protein
MSVLRRKTDSGYILHGFVDAEKYEVELVNNDEVFIRTEPNGTITKIDGRIHVGIQFKINGVDVDKPQNLQDIKDLLRDYYNDYLYSRELGYNGLTYTDVENVISLTILYSLHDGKPIWAILSSPEGRR